MHRPTYGPRSQEPKGYTYTRTSSTVGMDAREIINPRLLYFAPFFSIFTKTQHSQLSAESRSVREAPSNHFPMMRLSVEAMSNHSASPLVHEAPFRPHPSILPPPILSILLIFSLCSIHSRNRLQNNGDHQRSRQPALQLRYCSSASAAHNASSTSAYLPLPPLHTYTSRILIDPD